MTHKTRVALALALVLWARVLIAEEPSAEALFQEGRALMLEHRYAEACPKLERSHALEPRLGTLLNLAVCHEEEGKLGSAWGEYQRALEQAKAEGDATRERLASARVESLSPKVPRLTLSAEANAGERIEILLDGSALSPELFGHELPLDPGSHRVQARTGAQTLLDEAFTIAEGEHKRFSVPTPPKAAPAALPAAPPATPSRSTPPAPTAPAPSSPRERARIGPWVVELGLFAGLMVSDYQYPSAVSPDAFPLRNRTTGALSSCAERSCSYRMDNGTGLAAGIHVFGAYALSDELLLGARLLLGPRLGGGTLTAIGPSAVLHAGGPIWLGASVLFGDGTARADGHATPPAEYQSVDGQPHEIDGKLAGGFGAMLHADLVVHETERGAVVASALPFALFGSQGSVWAIPLAIGYRFR